MRILLLLFILLSGCNAAAATPRIVEVRSLYYSAASNRDSAERFLKMMDNIGMDAGPALLAYKGVAYMLKAKHAGAPWSKLAFFNKGKALIEKAIAETPGNTEARFIRFCVQSNSPAFLGYNKNIGNDMALIVKTWKALTDKDLKERIRHYMLHSKECSAQEKSILQ